MKPAVDPRDKTEEVEMPAGRGYEAWKRGKIERGLAEAKDRSLMIPVEQILRDLGLER